MEEIQNGTVGCEDDSATIGHMIDFLQRIIARRYDQKGKLLQLFHCI